MTMTSTAVASAAVTGPAAADLQRIRSLMVDYCYAIDEGDLKRWPDFFSAQCLYRITTRENESQNMPLSIMLCDSQAMLFDRVEAIEQANIFEPHTYRHILSDSVVTGGADETVKLKTSFCCIRTMLDGSMLLFAAGCYYDEVELSDDTCLLKSRTVVLDSSKVDTLLAIPL
jgi:anthranilate 1,2-dioxygenase small subunit